MRQAVAATLLFLLLTIPAHASSLDLLREAADRAGVPDSLMLAIAYVESQGVLTALNIGGNPVFPVTWDEGHKLLRLHARDNIDVGVMQVNLPTWGHRLGLSAHALYQPEVNLPVAANILRHCIDVAGGDLWQGVGCYHSQNGSRQRTYVQKIWGTYRRLRQNASFALAVPCTAARESFGSDQGTYPAPPRRFVHPQRPAVTSASATVSPLIATLRSAPGLPGCPTGQPLVTASTGRTMRTLVFCDPPQDTAEDLTDATGAAGVWVGCDRKNVHADQCRLQPSPVQDASVVLTHQRSVTCMPTVVTGSAQLSTGGLP